MTTKLLGMLLVVAALVLSGCKTTGSKQSKTQPQAQAKADKMVQIPVADKQIIKTIDKIDSISVQEYQIKKESLFRITFSNKLLFDFARSDSAKINLDDIKAFTRLYQQKSLGAYLYVVGHTDSVGLAQTNQSLSAQRGYTIANLLVKNGIAPDKIKIVAAGETIPVASNKSKGERAKNRRVEILSSDNRALNLEFFRQFDCSAIDSACRRSALPIFDVAMHQGKTVMRVPLKGPKRIETMIEKIKRKTLELPMQIRQSLNIQLDVRKALTLSPKYWVDQK